MAEDASTQAAIDEVKAMQGVIGDWAGQVGDAAGGALARCEAALADDFMLVRPDSQRVGRKAYLDHLKAARGALASRSPTLRMRVEDARARSVGNDTYIVTYDIWREYGDTHDARAMTVMLRKHSGAPGGFSWLHVHEAWLPGHGGKIRPA